MQKKSRKKNKKKQRFAEENSSESSEERRQQAKRKQKQRKRGKGRDPEQYPLSSSEILKSGSMASGAQIQSSQSNQHSKKRKNYESDEAVSKKKTKDKLRQHEAPRQEKLPDSIDQKVEPKPPAVDSSNHDKSIESDNAWQKSKEYLDRQEAIYISRMNLARNWVIIGEIYYFVRACIIIYPMWGQNSTFEHVMILIQTLFAFTIFLIILYSYKYRIEPILYTLYIQTALFLVSNFNIYRKENFPNSQGLNNLATIFSVIFSVINTLIASMVNDNEKQNYISTTIVFMGTVITLIIHDFDFENLTYHTIQALVISFICACVLAPAMVYFSKAIIQEQMNEAKLSYIERDSYRQLFDALQEGIIVVQDDQIMFMNALANRILTSMTKFKNFLMGELGQD